MDEDVVHIKLEYDEAIESKKDMLSSQISMIQLIKTVKKYHILRMEELKLKARLYKSMRSISSNIKNIKKLLPKKERPEILRQIGEDKENPEEKPKRGKENPERDRNLESQLEEIKRKLNSIA